MKQLLTMQLEPDAALKPSRAPKIVKVLVPFVISRLGLYSTVATIPILHC